MNQQQAWSKEYQNAQGVPTTTRTRPSSAVKRLVEYAKDHDIETGNRVIDLGCGIGRNSIYFLEQGYVVTAVDFAESALQKLEVAIKDHPARDNLIIKQVDLADKLPFEDNSFDIALDIVTTMSLKPSEWASFEAELRRVLRPGGLFVSWVLSRNDGVVRVNAPGESSYTVEESGITDYYFTEQELKELYKQWDLLEIEEVHKTDIFYGKEYERRIWWMLLRNKKTLKKRIPQ